MKISRTDTIFWDLDGTLVDPRQRLYLLFVELTRCDLSYDEYWQLKQQGKGQQKMLEYIGFTEFSAQEFKSKWLKNVERPDLLKKDVLFNEVIDTLSYVRNCGIKMYIVTNRQSYGGLREQLDDLNILDVMDGIISTFQKNTKAEAIQEVSPDVSNAIIVGDRLEDMQAANDLRIPGVLVARSKNGESVINADFCIEDLSGLRGIIG